MDGSDALEDKRKVYVLLKGFYDPYIEGVFSSLEAAMRAITDDLSEWDHETWMWRKGSEDASIEAFEVGAS